MDKSTRARESIPPMAGPPLPPLLSGSWRKEDIGQEKTISREDLLRSENLQLRLMNISLQEQRLVADISALREERGKLQQEYVALRRELEEKYGIDLSKSEIRAGDGVVVPTGSTK